MWFHTDHTTNGQVSTLRGNMVERNPAVKQSRMINTLTGMTYDVHVREEFDPETGKIINAVYQIPAK